MAKESRDSVRSLQRGLEILRAVNASGGIRAGPLAQAVDLPRPTVYRLLVTLEELGYVERAVSSDQFRVTRKAAGLGDGFDAGVLVAQHLGPIIYDLGHRFVWPFDLLIYENAAMVVQETTHARSPLSIDRGMIGRRLPVLRTSSGRAYLSFCPQEERAVILRHISRLDDPEDRPFLVARVLQQMIHDTRERGYAIRDGTEFNPKTSSISLPIIRGDVVLGCLSVIWIKTAMTLDEAVGEFVLPLQEATAAIVRSIDSAG
ncbi:MAG: DNA-binding transcriptional regulator [Xanthobacteraceae bacterium]